MASPNSAIMTTLRRPSAQLRRGVASCRSMAPCVLLAVSEMGTEREEPRGSPVSRQNTSSRKHTFFRLTEFLPEYVSVMAFRATWLLCILLSRSLFRLTSLLLARLSVLGMRMIMLSSPASFPMLSTMSSFIVNISSLSCILSLSHVNLGKSISETLFLM